MAAGGVLFSVRYLPLSFLLLFFSVSFSSICHALSSQCFDLPSLHLFFTVQSHPLLVFCCVGDYLDVVAHGGPITCMTVSVDESMVITASVDGSISFFLVRALLGCVLLSARCNSVCRATHRLPHDNFVLSRRPMQRSRRQPSGQRRNRV